MELIVDNEPASVTAKAVNIYSRAQVKTIELSSNSVHQLKLTLPFLSSEHSLSYPLSIYSELSQISNVSSILLGDSPLEKAQISSWVELSNSIPAQDFIDYLEKKLLSRTFLVSNHITLADITAYSITHKTLGGLTYSSKNKYPCILRWSSHLMNLPGMKGAIPEYEVPRKLNEVMETYERMFRSEENIPKVEEKKPEVVKKVEEEKKTVKQAEKKKPEPKAEVKKKELTEEQKKQAEEKKKRKELTEEQKKEIEEKKKQSGEKKVKQKQGAKKGKSAAEPTPAPDSEKPPN